MNTTATNNHKQSFSSFTRHVIIALFIVIFMLFLWKIIYALLLAFISILFSILLRSSADYVDRYLPFSHKWSLILTGLFFLLLFGTIIFFAAEYISLQFSSFVDAISKSLDDIIDWLDQTRFGNYILKSFSQTQPDATHVITVISQIPGVTFKIINFFVSIIIIILMALFFAANPKMYKEGILLLFPKNKSARISEVLDATASTLRQWMLGQLAAMLIVGIMVTVGLWIIGVPLPAMLGLITAILEFVPFIGPIAAAIPAILLTIPLGWKMVFYAVLVYFIVQQIEGNIVIPLIQKAVVRIPPALVLLAIIGFGLLFGVIGIIVATPLTAVAFVWVKMLYIEDVIHKPVNNKA